MAEEGLSTSLSTNGTGGRDATGKWLPGVSGNPKGRPNKAEELKMLDAIRSTFTPEETTAHLRRAMQLAIEQNSARGIVAVLEFMHDRTIGKPVQRVIQEGGGINEILVELGVIKE